MVVLATCPLCEAREQVSFNFGWKHAHPPPPPPPSPLGPCKPDAFPTDRSGQNCLGLTRQQQGDASAESCKEHCCADPGCSVWQWADLAKSKSFGCWLGQATCPTAEPSKGVSPPSCPRHRQTEPVPTGPWVGGERPGPSPAKDDMHTAAGYVFRGPGVNPPQAAPAFEDGAWEVAPRRSLHAPSPA